MKSTTKIAGLKTVADWIIVKNKFIENPNSPEILEEIFNDFLVKRISTRYFEPIDAISKISKHQGKGFSIVAIYCSLIEFFEMLKKGIKFLDDKKHYVNIDDSIVRSSRNFDPNGDPHCLSTKDIFIDFLTENSPFNQVFNVDLATEFYLYVRCPILHHAETKENWYIRNGKINDPIVKLSDDDPRERILNWKPMKKSFSSFIEDEYKNLFLNRSDVQKKLIWKFSQISGL